MKRFRKVYIEITNVCNLKCKFCLPTNRKPTFMEIEVFEKILNKVFPYTDLIYLHLKGEPLLHPDIDKILLLCEEKKVKVNITTNGTLINKVKAKLENKTAIRQINFSLHSISENDHLFDVNKYLETIFNFMNDNSNIIYSLRLWNVDKDKNHIHNYDVIKIIEDNFNVANLFDLLHNQDSIKLKDKVYLNQDIKFNWPKKTNENIYKSGFCYGLRDQIGILVDGTVVPCCLDGDGVINLGNIINEDLSIIINSKLANDIYEGFSKREAIHELCQKCDYKNRF